MTVLDDFAPRRPVWPARTLAVLLLAAAVGVIAALVLTHATTRVVTRTVPAPAEPVVPAANATGAVLAAERFMQRVDAGQAGSFTVGYRLLASTRSTAMIETLASSAVDGPDGRTTNWWVWQLPLAHHRRTGWTVSAHLYGQITSTPAPELYTRWPGLP